MVCYCKTNSSILNKAEIEDSDFTNSFATEEASFFVAEDALKAGNKYGHNDSCKGQKIKVKLATFTRYTYLMASSRG